MLNQLKELIKEREKITDKINVIYHKMFADYLNNELKLYNYKDKMMQIDAGKKCYFNLPYSFCEDVLNWLKQNNIEIKSFEFNGVFIEFFDVNYYSGRIRFSDKSTELEFLKDWKINF